MAPKDSSPAALFTAATGESSSKRRGNQYFAQARAGMARCLPGAASSAGHAVGSSRERSESPEPRAVVQRLSPESSPRSGSPLTVARPDLMTAPPLHGPSPLAPAPKPTGDASPAATRQPQRPALNAGGVDASRSGQRARPFLDKLGFRLDSFEFTLRRAGSQATRIAGKVLRPLGESEMQTVLDTPPKELPAVPVEHKALSSSMGQTAVSYLAESRFAKSRGMTPGITLGHLGHNGCLANPDDLAAAIAGYEGLLTLYASRLALCEGVAEILKLETLSVEEAKVWATARGPQPLPWEAKRSNEPAYSTSRRKRAIARGLRNLIAHSLGGEEGFVRWIVDEMERSPGRKGVLKDKRIFEASFLHTLLESDKLHAELKRLIERRGRPTLLRFAVATSGIRQRDVNKLRELQPGFYPGPNKIRQGKRTHLGAFLRDVCSGGWSPVSMTTGLSEAAEAEERERRLALDRVQADADDAGLVAEARRELEAAAEGESSGSESEGVNEWESDGEQEPTPAEVEADKAVGKGYGVEDMRDAHQAMIFVNLAFTVAEPGTKSSQLVCKLTEDKANFDYLSRAGLKSATSAQLEYISQGVIGPDMVDHQLTCAQSSRGAFPLVKTRAGDSRPQIEIDLVSLMEQQDSIDKYGLENVALLSQLPPVIITFGNTADELSTMSG